MIEKFKIGDRVKVHDSLETTIERIELNNGEYNYWFKDENGKSWYDSANAIELIKTK